MKKFSILALLFLLALTWKGLAQDYTQEVTAIQYYFNTDPGTGTAGNGGIIPVTPAATVNEVFNLSLPSLPEGINYLYVRAKDEFGKWSLAERRVLYISGSINQEDITAVEYYFDNDPGAGNGTVQSVGPTSAWSGTLTIALPGNLDPGVHYLYIRTQDSGGTWSMVERRLFYISTPTSDMNVVALEYYYDNDPGPGNANPVDITDTASFSGVVSLGVPCLSEGTHYLYLRARDESGRWSVIGRDTLEVESGIDPTAISPAGPLTFCPTGSVTLSFDSIPGIIYQWQKDAVDIPGATSSMLTINEAGNYQVKAYCGPVFSISNVVQASVLPVLTYYADADNDGFGDFTNDSLDCSQPAGYVLNSDDCDDSDENVNPAAIEVCNGIDDDCDGFIDEEGGNTYYADADLDGYGDPLVAMTSCTIPAGYVDNNLDCDDSDANINPTAIELCNGIDDNCDGNIDEGYVYSVAGASITSSGGTSFCDGTTTMLAVVGGVLGTGADWFWYEGSCGGTPLGSGPSVSVTPTTGVHQYFVRAEGICNFSDCVFIEITAGDTEAPTISGCPGNITQEAEEGQWGASVSWTEPVASDNCVLVNLTSSQSPGDFFNVGTTVVTYIALDEAGNASECQFFVTVTPPDFLGTVNISVISSDITFSENSPEPGTSINVNAVIRNNSNINAGSFEVQFTEQFTNTVYPVFTVPGLNAGQSIVVNEFIAMPNIAAFVPILVSIDISDDLDESSEQDNIAIRPVICGEVAMAGNVDVLASAVPASTPAGSVIQICGSASYDTDPPLADPTVAGAEVVITIGETGQQFMGYTNEDGEFCISYTTPNTPGEYHFTVDITDNTLTGDVSGTFTLTEPVYVCPLDLTVSLQLTGLPANHIVALGSSFSGTVYVQNNCTAISDTTVLFISPPAGTFSAYTVNIPPLGPGETYPVTLPSITLNATGEFFISATVDYEGGITEDYENNNTAYAVIIVLPPKPDIVAAGGSVLSDLQCFSDNLVSFTLKNAGLVATGEFDCEFNLYINNVWQSTSTASVSNLNPEEYTLLTFPFTASSTVDTFRFELIADIPDVVDELYEFNNVYSFRQIFNECLPDLVVLGCDFTDVKPADPMVSGNVTVTATIRNQGELPVNEPFDVEFNVGGMIVTETVTDQLLPGQSMTLSVDSPVSTTECGTLTIVADPDNDIVEHYEANSYSAALCYDFEFETINCLGVQIFPGTQYFCDPGTFRIGFWNFGLYEASNFQVKFEISGPGITGWQTLGTESVYAANSCGCPSTVGYSGTFYFPQTGAYLVRMTADPDDLYEELDESNNEIILGVNVVESADYEVLSPYIFPSDINPDINEVVSFSVSYTNTGCTGFSPIELFARMDNDPLDSVIVSPLPSGGWNTVAIPNTWSSAVPGVHVFRAIIDHDEAIDEANELNNEATKAIIVGGAPDYHVLSISVSDDSPELGDVITINTSVLNEGQSQGTGTLQFLAADGEGNEVLIYAVDIAITPGNTEPFTATWLTQDPNARIIARVVNVTPMEFDLSDNEKETQLNELLISLTGTDALCSSENSGMITVNVTGGTPTFSFAWSDPALFGPVVNVPAGEYSVTVLDANGLSATASIAISEPDALVVSETHTDASCDNLSDGAIDLVVAGGTAPFAFSWNNGESTEDLSNLSEGNYTVTVTDQNGCSETLSISLVALANATTWYQDADNDGYGNANASVMACDQPAGYVSAPGDCDDNNVAVNPGATEVCNNNTDDDCDGQIDEGCNTSCDISVEAGTDVTTYFGITSQQTVTRTAVVSGGTAPYTFSWSLGRPLLCNQMNSSGDEAFFGGTCQDNTCPSSGSPADTAICSGNATITATLLDTALVCVTVTDANGCTATDCFYVNASDIRCFAGNSGNHKIKVCHKTSSPVNPWVEICIDTNALNTHLSHGDYIGPCDFTKESDEDLDEHHEFHFHLYPNPASEKVMIDFVSGEEGTFRIEIVNMTGLVICQVEGNTEIGENIRQLNLPGYAPGLYLVRLTLGDHQKLEKLILER